MWFSIFHICLWIIDTVYLGYVINNVWCDVNFFLILWKFSIQGLSLFVESLVDFTFNDFMIMFVTHWELIGLDWYQFIIDTSAWEGTRATYLAIYLFIYLFFILQMTLYSAKNFIDWAVERIIISLINVIRLSLITMHSIKGISGSCCFIWLCNCKQDF